MVLIYRRAGWRGLLKPQHLIAAVISIVVLKAWGSYVDSVNQTYLPEWTSSERIKVFLGPWQDRFRLKPWAMAFSYVGAFIIPGPAALVVAYGLWRAIRKGTHEVLALWLISLVAFYLIWFGSAATGQNYYNMPAVGPLAALFGLGMGALLGHWKLARWRKPAMAVAIVLVVLPALPFWRYLFNQDRGIYAAAMWARENTKAGDVILFRPNHHWAAIDYPYDPIMAYYSQRPTFVWTKATTPLFREEALRRARYALVTTPQPEPPPLLAAFNRFRQQRTIPESVAWLDEAGFRPVARETGFVAYQRDLPLP